MSPDMTLQQVLDAAADGATLDLGGQTFLEDAPVILTGRTGLTIQNLRLTRTTTAKGRPAPHLRLIGCSDIILDGCRISGTYRGEGYNDDLEAQHALDLIGCAGVIIQNCRLFQVWGDGIYMGRNARGAGSGWCADIVVKDCRIESVGRQGIGITGAERVLIFGNYIGGVARSIMDIEPNTYRGGGKDITFQRNEIGPGRLLFIAAAGAGVVTNVAIIENVSEDHALNIAVVGGSEDPDGNLSVRANFTVNDNRTTRKFGAPGPTGCMKFYDVEGLEVCRNVQPIQRARDVYTVSLRRCEQWTVEDNLYPGGPGELLVDGVPAP